VNGDFVIQAIDSAGAGVLFGILVLVSFALVMLLILFALLALRAVWRWLTLHNWNDVIRSTERKALN
jgi:hypothetical protein